jgi:hypothetical protein
MAVRHGYGKIAGTDALVFAYDTGDTSNSYKGEPTTNLAADLGLTDLGAGLTYLGIEDGWKKYSMSGTWSGGGYPYSMALNGVSFTGGLPYSVVATLKTNVENKFNYFCTSGISYVNQPKDYEGTLSATLNPDGSRTVRRVNFAYTSTTGQLGYLFTNPINGVTFNPATDFVWVKDYQAEQKTHPTPFVNSTRSSTQGLLDLTGNSTIDISPTSFNSNAEIEYDGSNDYIYVGSKTWSFPNGATVEQIIKPLTLNLQQGFFTLNGAGSYINFWMPSNNTMRWEVIGTTSQGYSTINCTTVFQTGQYYHVVGTFNGTTTNIYINGIEENGQTMTNQPTSMTAQMDIGRYDTSYPSSAQIPVTKFYTRPLTAAEIKNNYNQYRTRFNI